jgi:hypothetical protein
VLPSDYPTWKGIDYWHAKWNHDRTRPYQTIGGLCTICSHSYRGEIEERIKAGYSLEELYLFRNVTPPQVAFHILCMDAREPPHPRNFAHRCLTDPDAAPQPIEVLLYEDSAKGTWEKIAESIKRLRHDGRTDVLALLAGLSEPAQGKIGSAQ